MADGKWIHGLKPTTPLADAAQRVLSVRLEVIRDYLPLAVIKPDEDPEYVHLLRVGTRRASAAVELFADCLPDKVHKSARKQVRCIRRAAGEARDWDVFLLALQERERPAARELPGHDFLFGYAHGQRAAAQAELQAVDPEQPGGFQKFLAETVAAVREPSHGQHTLIDLARPRLVALLHNLDQAAAQDLNNYENLHQVRIAGKQLRYAMEVFADCFAPPFREELYAAVEEMQDILGLANDSHVAVGRLSAVREKLRKTAKSEWKRLQPGIEGLLRYHQRRLPQERRRFLKWWDRWQVSGAETVLNTLLHGPEAALA